MKSILHFTLLFLFALSQNIANAHFCEDKKVKCPIDSTEVNFCVTISFYASGSYKDLQKTGAMGCHYQQLINNCPKCLYAGYIDDFKKELSTKQKNKILKLLKKYKKQTIGEGQQSIIAANIKKILKEKFNEIAFCYIYGSYLIRDVPNEIELRKKLQTLGKKNLIADLKANEFTNKSKIAVMNYLVAELSRRLNNFDQPLLFYDKAFKDSNKPKWLDSYIIEQKALAQNKDNNNNI
ncbi:DUF2225 domain-containing protein [Flavobacterium davisii]|uniref:DUF2225 domain-containing protein n=1 Tax=Flavobacterium davisii TaxID=2906077 RepID=A0ABW8PP98_9FLAO